MADKVFVSMDMATPVAVKVDAYGKEHNCKMNQEDFAKALKMYRDAREFMISIGGKITDVEVSEKKVSVVSEVPFFDVMYEKKDLMQEFVSTLDTYDVVPVTGDYLIMTYGVTCSWEEA